MVFRLLQQYEKQRKVSPTNCRHTIAFVSTVTDEKYANDNRQIPFAIPQKILPITCKARQNLI